jgi:hypothetical protein
MEINTMQYSELKPKQQEFIQWLFDDGNHDEDKTMFQRGYLKRVANDNGMAWAPAWLVKDTGRVSKRGFYNVPELADFIREASGTASDEDALIERMQDEAVSESESSTGDPPVESSATVAA